MVSGRVDAQLRCDHRSASGSVDPDEPLAGTTCSSVWVRRLRRLRSTAGVGSRGNQAHVKGTVNNTVCMYVCLLLHLGEAGVPYQRLSAFSHHNCSARQLTTMDWQDDDTTAANKRGGPQGAVASRGLSAFVASGERSNVLRVPRAQCALASQGTNCSPSACILTRAVHITARTVCRSAGSMGTTNAQSVGKIEVRHLAVANLPSLPLQGCRSSAYAPTCHRLWPRSGNRGSSATGLLCHRHDWHLQRRQHSPRPHRR
jgi:hypothetical protein